MRKPVTAIGLIVIAGQLAMSAGQQVDRQQLQIKPKDLQVKPVTDPKRIIRSSAREFAVASPDMGTRSVRGVCAAAGGLRSFVLVYEALTDETVEGLLRPLVIVRDPDMNELAGPTPIVPEGFYSKSSEPRYHFLRLLLFPGTPDKYLCVYEVWAQGERHGYFQILDPFAKDRIGSPRRLGSRSEDISIADVHFLPGTAHAVILYNAFEKKKTTHIGSRYVVVGPEGKQIYRGQVGINNEDSSVSMASGFGFMPDGRWAMVQQARRHNVEWDIRFMDPYGAWTGPAMRDPDNPMTAQVHFAETLLPHRLLLRIGHVFIGRFAIWNKGAGAQPKISFINQPPYEMLHLTHAERLADDRLMLFYLYGKSRDENALQAMITDLWGRELKPPQDIMRCDSQTAAFARPWGKPSDMVVFSPDTQAKTGKFRYITITE